MSSGGDGLECRHMVTNPAGLHARPAARSVQTGGACRGGARRERRHRCRTVVGPQPDLCADAGRDSGRDILVRARGPQVQAAPDALRGLTAGDFDELSAPIPEQQNVTPQRGDAAALSVAGAAAVRALARRTLGDPSG